MSLSLKQNNVQNDMFFIQEFYKTFIEKIINVFDSNGEISSYWSSVKQKIKEEKSCQSLYKYISKLEIKKKVNSNLDIFDPKKCYSMNIPSIPNINLKTTEDDQPLSLKKTPSTNVKTVLIQFDQLNKISEMNSNQSTPSTLPAQSPAAPPPLLITKTPSSITLKNGLDSPHNLNSPHNIQSPMSAQATPTYQTYSTSGFNTSTKRILDSLKKRNSTPSSIQSPLNIITTLQKNANEKKERLDTCDSSPEKQQQPRTALKRFTPQQIMRMGSIREAEEEQTEQEKEKQLNHEIVGRLLLQVTQSQNSFKRDTETLNLIHGKFTLASAENCRNSQGLNFSKTSHNPNRPYSGISEFTKFCDKPKIGKNENNISNPSFLDAYIFGNNTSTPQFVIGSIQKTDVFTPK